MIEPPPRTLRLRLDREALASNWQAMDRLSGAAQAGAAVKADAYGIGVATAAPELRRAGCRLFYVAHWSEVGSLLDHVSPHEVVVLHGPIHPEDVAYARATEVRPVINSLAQAQLWLDGGGGPCDLMLDTGINRLGLPPRDIGAQLVARLQVETLMSHLASADEDSPQNEVQRKLFDELSQHVRHRRRSLANSAGIALGPSFAYDVTRPGLSLYGGVPRPELAGEIRQVAFPQAAVLQLRDLAPGDSVGYNATFTADRKMRVATVSLGYADGFLRGWSGKGALRFGEAALPLLGRVSMDMVVVDCGAVPELREGDWLDIPYRLPEAVSASGLSQYELLTTLGRRFQRLP